jgi:hypothetical protein
MRQGNAAARAASAPAYYQWQIQGNPLSIQISFAVIDQLEADIMKGFRSAPNRGAEVGGVLFGRVASAGETATVYIDDYEPVPCEYRRGASYTLSEGDRKRLERTLRKGHRERQVVGLYRSHTRPGLYLDQDDDSLIQSCFANPNHVFLLVRPHASKTSVGGFFFWEEGSIHRQSTYLEFPFSTGEILKRRHSSEPPAEAGLPAAAAAPPAIESAAAAAPRPVRVAERAPRVPKPYRVRLEASAATLARSFGWRPLATVAALLVLLGFAEYGFVRRLAQPAPAAAAGDSPVLRVERNGSFLQVGWNRNAASVLNAERGVLLITDGPRRRELTFNAGQLRTGTVAYSPAGNVVSFRLELVGGRTTVSESLRVVDALAPVRAAPGTRAAVISPPLARPRPPAPAVAEKPQPASTRQAKARRRRAYFDDGL